MEHKGAYCLPHARLKFQKLLDRDDLRRLLLAIFYAVFEVVD